MSPERALLWVGLSAGLLFVALTPPFQAPDEPSHFRRIYQMSEGTLFPSRGGEGSLPESVVRLGETLRGDLPFHPEKRADPRALAAAFSQPLNAAQRIPARVGGAVYSTPFLYLPQALTAWVARQLDLPPLFLFYLCRLVNLATGLALAWAAVRRAPFYRWLFVLLALDPMALFLRSSLSPDASVDALALFFVATVLALAAGEAKPAPGSLAALLGSAALLALSKGAVYLLVPAAALLIPACRLGGRRRAAAVFGALFALTFGGVALAGWAARRADFPGLRPEVATDPAAQLQHILAHPGHFLEVISKSALLQGPGIAFQLVGNLGWLDTPLPKLA
ncbi:MAG TPA: DUF2142 domain-containing protein, partial [Thermoanaerobaculia bacterium]|nr:DUF2142 domain-containing protein [Thermoanaerobaculia bacterium]